MKLLQSHRRVPWLTATIGVNIAFILVLHCGPVES